MKVICNNADTMIKENALAAYKNKPAIIKEITSDKIIINTPNGEKISVREKDILILYPDPADKWFGDHGSEVINFGPGCAVREAWELLLAEGGTISLKELSELAYGEYSPSSAWNSYCLLSDGLYFSGTIDAISPRQKDHVETEEKKRAEKERAGNERGLFLDRLRKRETPAPDDARFMQDIEALACGKSAKSRTMKELCLGETPEEAHALLLSCGFWQKEVNPHASRYGISLIQAQQVPDAPPQEDRADLTRLEAYAIDSPWSHDPDDAVSLETENGRQILYVHVADPSSSIGINSPHEKEARDRGATLYIPEGSFRMLAEEAIPVFALGIGETSAALTFKMTLNANGETEKSEIFPSIVKVRRMTYEEADNLKNANAVIDGLNALAERNIKRREAAGAVAIDLPEVRIGLNQGKVFIEPIARHRSSLMVRECMLLAGEAAGNWAIQRNIAIPFIEQELAETPVEIPTEIFPGLAGSYQLRRCMKGRNLSVKPGLHQGLGLDVYTQVTSPLRRYTDLLSHIQIRSFIRNETLLPPDEIAARMIAGEEAASAVAHAERASRSHWTMVYLSDKKDSVWEAVALEKKGSRWVVIIPELGLETQIPIRQDIAPNEKITIVLKSANIPQLEASFVTADM